MKAMISTEQDEDRGVSYTVETTYLPIIIKSTEVFPLCGQSVVRGKRGDETGKSVADGPVRDKPHD